MHPLVSVCIPVFNGAPFIARAIESVLAQTFTAFELVVLNNASTDATAEIVAGYGRDHRLRVIHNPVNIGVIGNFNKALTIAQGAYLKILCADDYLYAECLAKQVAVFEDPQNTGVVMVCCSRDIVDEDGVKWLRRGFPGQAGRLRGGVAIRRNARSGANLLGEPSSVLLRTEAVRETGFFNAQFSLCVDLDYWSRLLLRGDLYMIPESLCGFRISRKSWSMSVSRSQISDYLSFLDHLAQDKRYGLTRYDLWKGRWMARINGRLRPLFSRVVFCGLSVKRRALARGAHA